MPLHAYRPDLFPDEDPTPQAPASLPAGGFGVVAPQPEFAQGQFVPFEDSEVLTVNQMVDAYLDGTVRRQTGKVLTERKRLLKMFCGDFGGKPAVSVRRFQVEDWINGHPKWVADNTIKRVIGTIQTCFSWAARGDRIEHNPIAGLSHPAGQRGRPLELEEFQALLRSTTPIFRRVLIFLRFTGMRPHEMSELEWSMIDAERGCIVLAVHKTVRTRKDRAPRVIVLHPVAIKLLIWIRDRQRESNFVFLNARRRPWNKNSLGLRIGKLRDKAHLPKTAKLYGTRHLFGTQCILTGVDLKILAELMGHTTTRMTEHYVHVAGKIAHMQDALSKAFGPG